ncbi:MAG TPA: hypothetical protein VD978_25690 [Azospirillum sp.]|nr:hypothetical protein [Azospirillum sp.]
MTVDKTVYCTVISRSYLRRAAAFYASLRRFHPDAEFHALVVDVRKTDDIPERAYLPFTIVSIDEVPVHAIEVMRLYYDAMELICALKPSLIRHLLVDGGARKVIYVDADAFVAGRFDVAEDLLDRYDLLLTPHTTKPLPLDGKLPDDLEIADYGVYNGGFWGVRNSPRALEIMNWLIARLRVKGFAWPERHMFCDQKLLPLAAQFAGDGFHALTHPGYNLAYWNLHERDLVCEDGRFLANGEPAVFFHLSGYDEKAPEVFTKHTDRFTVENRPVLREVLAHYRGLLAEAPAAEATDYGYAVHNGVRLTPAMRRHFFVQNNFERRLA